MQVDQVTPKHEILRLARERDEAREDVRDLVHTIFMQRPVVDAAIAVDRAAEAHPAVLPLELVRALLALRVALSLMYPASIRRDEGYGG
jgi:hypothetical protein